MTPESQVIIYAPDVNLTERKSALNNNIQEVVTVSELVGTSPYKVYSALLTQSGTDAPVATVLENTLGFDISWQINNTGYYFAVSDGEFDQLKTFVTIGSAVANSASTKCYRSSSNYVAVKTYSSGTTLSNDILLYTPIEIRVYE